MKRCRAEDEAQADVTKSHQRQQQQKKSERASEVAPVVARCGQEATAAAAQHAARLQDSGDSTARYPQKASARLTWGDW